MADGADRAGAGVTGPSVRPPAQVRPRHLRVPPLGAGGAGDLLTEVATDPRSGLRRVEPIMGTTFELDLRDAADVVDEDAIDRAFAWLHDVDRRFSTYRPDSEISRLGRGEIRESDASSDVQVVLAECEAMRRRTGGYFSIRPGAPGGTPDPSGYVKGWAIERAAEILAIGGARNFCLNGGGDVVARGRPSTGATWRLGIRHPMQRNAVAAVIGVSDLAVATSGAYERGRHIRDPHTGRAAVGLLSVTVVGPSMTVADVFATAAFAMGRDGPLWVAAQPGYASCAITTDQRLLTSAGFEALRLPS